MHEHSIEEMKANFEEQLDFLSEDCDRFDQGDEKYIKRMAVTIRILFKKSKNDTPLLEEIGESKNRKFVNTILFLPSSPGSSFAPLAPIAIFQNEQKQRYVPLLDQAPFGEPLEFDAWWNAPVLGVLEKGTLSRRELILAVAEKDGGAHVDRKLKEPYASLKSESVLNWNPMGLASGIENKAIAASVRQIAHEVLKTFRSSYQRLPRDYELLAFSPPENARIRVVNPASL
jgi:hypothetical protein